MGEIWVVQIDYDDEVSDVIGVAPTFEDAVALVKENHDQHNIFNKYTTEPEEAYSYSPHQAYRMQVWEADGKPCHYSFLLTKWDTE